MPILIGNACLSEWEISLTKERCSHVVYILFIPPRLKPSCKIDRKVTNLLSNVNYGFQASTHDKSTSVNCMSIGRHLFQKYIHRNTQDTVIALWKAHQFKWLQTVDKSTSVNCIDILPFMAIILLRPALKIN